MTVNPKKFAESLKFVADSWSDIFKIVKPNQIKTAEEYGKNLCLTCYDGTSVKIRNGAVAYRLRFEAAIYGLVKGYPLDELSRVFKPFTLGQLSSFYDDLLKLTERERFEILSSHAYGLKHKMHEIDPQMAEKIPGDSETVDIDRFLKEREIANSLKIPEDEYTELAEMGRKLRLRF